MTEHRTQAEMEKRWDIHTERQISIAKAGVVAVTVLNSGSWLALLSQADKVITLAKPGSDASEVFLFWGVGAFLGTFTWLFIYLAALTQSQHDFYRDVKRHEILLVVWRILGLLCVVSAVASFLMGVVALSKLATV